MKTLTPPREKAVGTNGVKPVDSGITTVIMDVTPDMAHQWLENQGVNRRIKKLIVNRYARIMADGGWVVNGETIKFDRNGRMIDGQHRCAAIVASGCTVKLAVTTGLPPEVFPTLDSGSIRQAHDVAQIAGYANCHVVTSAARICMDYGNESFGFSGKYSNNEILEFLETHPTIHECPPTSKSLKAVVSPSVACGLSYLFYLATLDLDMTQYFFRKLGEPFGLESRDPIFALHQRLVSSRARRGRTTRQDFVILITTAWNSHITGKTRTYFRINRKTRDGDMLSTKDAFQLILNQEGGQLEPSSVLLPE